jgi:hypothetical protein
MKKCMPWRNALLIAALLASSTVQSYQPELHQQLTFLAAKQASRCAAQWAQTDAALTVGKLSALDMRYVVRANVARAKGNFFGRMFRWNYLDVSQHSSQPLWGMFDTRFNARFHGTTVQITGEAEKRERLQALGDVLSYLQDVSTPSRVVPVYTGRWWSFSLQDRFDRYPVDEARLESAATGICESVLAQYQQLDAQTEKALSQLLFDSARQTIMAVSREIDGMPAQWTAFWQPANPSLGDDGEQAFGEYGVAGNKFGERVEFPCGDGKGSPLRCLLLDDDPLYQDFAFARHLSALQATMVAMLVVQQRDIL